jgi:hypothetical protein
MVWHGQLWLLLYVFSWLAVSYDMLRYLSISKVVRNGMKWTALQIHLPSTVGRQPSPLHAPVPRALCHRLLQLLPLLLSLRLQLRLQLRLLWLLLRLLLLLLVWAWLGARSIVADRPQRPVDIRAVRADPRASRCTTTATATLLLPLLRCSDCCRRPCR